MGPSVDPEAFLVTFEWVATAARWPPKYWATLLAPYLTVQEAYWGMDPQDVLDYGRMRRANLDLIRINCNMYHQLLPGKVPARGEALCGHTTAARQCLLMVGAGEMIGGPGGRDTGPQAVYQDPPS